jgi:hypothetical protein
MDDSIETLKQMSRWAQFRAALKFAGITAKQWCEERDLTEGHLYQCLRGDRDTESTFALLDSFIAEQYARANKAA